MNPAAVPMLESMTERTKRSGIKIATAVLLALTAPGPLASAQSQNTVIVPGQPAPVPLPPAPPPVINTQPQSVPPKLDTFSDKVSRCLHYGGTIGLPPGQLDTFTRACANN